MSASPLKEGTERRAHCRSGLTQQAAKWLTWKVPQAKLSTCEFLFFVRLDTKYVPEEPVIEWINDQLPSTSLGRVSRRWRPQETHSHTRRGGDEVSICDRLPLWAEIFALHSPCPFFRAAPDARWFRQRQIARLSGTTIRVGSTVSAFATFIGFGMFCRQPKSSLGSLTRETSWACETDNGRDRSMTS
jgi:hypothetical protein